MVRLRRSFAYLWRATLFRVIRIGKSGAAESTGNAMNKISELAASQNAVSSSGSDWLRRTELLFTSERRKTLVLISLAWILVACLYMLPYIVQVQDRLNIETIVAHLLVATVGMVVSVVLLGAVAKARRRNGFEAFLWSSLAVLAASAATSTIDVRIFEWTYVLFGSQWADSVPYVVKWTSNFAIFTSQFSMIAIIFWTLETYQAHRRNEAELQRARLSAAESQVAASAATLASLRYQLNPHFLFNTLNSISSLVVTERNDKAEEMLSQLSEFLRITLAEDPDAPQTLERELETIASYLAIERVRFGDRLAIDVICPPKLREAQMPNFLLQPLVENSIKYGVANSEETVTIRVEAMVEGENLVVLVEDDGRAGDAAEPGHGIGLRNVRKRMEAIYGKSARLEVVRRDCGFLSVVRIPFELV